VDFFIQSYTNPGDKVLDITCYNAITGARCQVLGRNYVGMDMHPQIDNGIPVITGINASADARRPVKEYSDYKKGQKIYVRPGQEGARYVG
jgi:hypothetical protein